MQSPHDTKCLLHNIEILLEEFEHFRRTGNRLHLAHAVRALDEARDDLHKMLRTRALAS